MEEGAHIVRLQIPLEGGDFGNPEEVARWMELEKKLEKAIRQANVGGLDGNEVGLGQYEMWFFGEAANPLAEIIRANLPPLPAGSILVLHHGDIDDEDTPEETVPLP